MSVFHGIELSIRQLERVLRSKCLFKRKYYSSLPNVICTIEHELSGSGNSIGYRQMHQRLIIDHSFVVQRQTVQIILKHLDPEGMRLRSRKAFRRREYYVRGPNYMWHLDGYDKLKPFGFAIHGAIDGYSRRMLWLKVGPTNNDPSVITNYYLSTVHEIGGAPRIIRVDRGTENSYVARLQGFFYEGTPQTRFLEIGVFYTVGQFQISGLNHGGHSSENQKLTAGSTFSRN